MKTVPSALATHMAGSLTTMATCWRVTRKDGVTLAFTDHDQDITGVLDDEATVYAAATGYNRSALQSSADLSVDNLEISGLLDSAAITPDDIRAGVYDGADVRVFLVNWAAPADGVLKLSRGTIGDISIKGGLFVAEQRGLKQPLDIQFVRVYAPDCDADLGDARCTVDLASFTDTGTVTAVADAHRVFTASLADQTADYYAGGLIQFDTGLNATPRPPVEVRSVLYVSTGVATVTLYLPIGFAIAIGDTFSIVAGCDKSAATCKAKFSNLVNFRGFPFIPGLDKTVQTPNAV